MTIIKNQWPAVLVAGAIVLLASVLFLRPTFQTYASVSQGSEYQSTTTSSLITQANISIVTGTPGTLGSIVLTGTSTGAITLYDATTSNVNLRTKQAASSTITLANIPIDASPGTYTFDSHYFNGLYLNISGTAPTTTITFR